MTPPAWNAKRAAQGTRANAPAAPLIAAPPADKPFMAAAFHPLGLNNLCYL